MLFELGRTLAQVKAIAKKKVDTEAEGRMAAYLTPGSAIAVEYVSTKADALRWLADEAASSLGADETYPFVHAEMQAQIAGGATGTTMEDAVDLIMTSVGVYETAAATIKEQRRTAKLLIDAATTIPGARAAAEVTWAA
jgi:hypothetical protein